MPLDEDKIVYINSLNFEQVANNLTINDVERFLRSLGIDNLILLDDHIICPTYCHNRLDEDASMKLYWYQNHHCFHCYTECNESMSIFTFYQRFMALNYGEVSFEDALYYIRQFLTNIDNINETAQLSTRYQSPKERFQPRHQLNTNLKIYNPAVLDVFVDYVPKEWYDEGISPATMKKFGIKLYLNQSNIVIPCYNLNHELIGIRCREMDDERISLFSKYHPITIGQTMYSFPTSQTLYGLYENQTAIRKYKKVVLVEGEKTVLKGYDFFGKDSVVVASFGLNNFGFYQLNILTKELGVTDIVIAFDKDFYNCSDVEGLARQKKIIELCHKYSNFANFSYIHDTKNLLNYKDSPLDRGIDIFNQLYQERIYVK